MQRFSDFPLKLRIRSIQIHHFVVFSPKMPRKIQYEKLKRSKIILKSYIVSKNGKINQRSCNYTSNIIRMVLFFITDDLENKGTKILRGKDNKVTWDSSLMEKPAKLVLGKIKNNPFRNREADCHSRKQHKFLPWPKHTKAR